MKRQGLVPGNLRLHVVLTVKNNSALALQIAPKGDLCTCTHQGVSCLRNYLLHFPPPPLARWSRELGAVLVPSPSLVLPLGSSPSGQDQGSGSQRHQDAARICSYQQRPTCTHASWVLTQLVFLLLSPPICQPSTPLLWPSSGRAGSERQGLKLGSLAPDPNYLGKRGAVRSQKQKAGVVQLLAWDFFGEQSVTGRAGSSSSPQAAICWGVRKGASK